ncbi:MULTISPECIES: NAD(P)/FAD-dependent oxidoreductase [Lysobacter]|uniref:NAD(P)/FAD-dependent oxidoreductase n=1 Tax=Lysobacter TaxID=68 RepID=UPI001F26DB3D|nr:MULTISPECIES: FAD-binding oxidoreductase [Lysobacter]UJB21380.1 FAD-binding oxidoreductase [Lysobacter capsici]UJQ29504.1 FAD-binding oxidoreductase [Lysobacter gummosus]
MDLKSGYPFWAIRNGLMHAFPRLQQDLRCEVAVIGGGISGALIADELAAHGFEVAVIEQRDAGWGSTAASTALLQYEIDTHLIDLCARYGETLAARAYLACAQAIGDLRTVARDLRDVDFRDQSSLYYASKPAHVAVLREEAALRARHGLRLRWLDAEALASDYGLRAPGAILSECAASVDPYRMSLRLLARLRKRGAQVFDRSRIERMQAGSRSVELISSDGVRVRAEHVVVAAGYAGQQWIDRRLARNRSSYAFVTDPLPAAELQALKDTMVWESARPYLYMRSTGDGRLVVGGCDDAIDIPARRDRRVESRAKKLVRKVGERLPRLELQPAFAWAGTFAETADGLPWFGPHPQHGPRVQFAMAYGGNGITYSMIGAGLLRARIQRRKHPLANLFSFERLK